MVAPWLEKTLPEREWSGWFGGEEGGVAGVAFPKEAASVVGGDFGRVFVLFEVSLPELLVFFASPPLADLPLLPLV